MASSQGKEEHMETTEEKRERFRAELKEMNDMEIPVSAENLQGFKPSKRRSSINFRIRWPIHEMEIGDEIVIQQGRYGVANPQRYALQYGYSHNKKFRTKKVAQDTYRIVRIA